MPKEIFISGAELVAALDRVSAIMKEEVAKLPDLTYHVADGGSLNPPSLAVIFRFDPKTLRHTDTEICSEKRAAKEWNKANGIKI